MIMSIERTTVSLIAGLLLSPTTRQQSASPLGRWIGESRCVGAHPACHDEQVVYQVDSTGPQRFTLDGRRFAGSDTVDMGTLSCEGNGSAAMTCPIPTGSWHFAVIHDHLDGTLILHDNTVMRRVVAYRARPHD